MKIQGGFMIALFLCLIASLAGLSLTLLLVPGFVMEDIGDFALSVFILTMLNFVLTPMLLGMNLKIKVSSLGIFSFFMNLFLLNIATGLIDEFSVNSMSAAIFGAGLLGFFQVWLDYLDPQRGRVITRP